MNESFSIPKLREEVIDKMTSYREIIMVACVDIINAGGDTIYIGKLIPNRADILDIGITKIYDEPTLLQDINNWLPLYMSSSLMSSFKDIGGETYIAISGLQSTKTQ